MIIIKQSKMIIILEFDSIKVCAFDVNISTVLKQVENYSTVYDFPFIIKKEQVKILLK